MLGVPSSPGVLGWALLAAGGSIAAAGCVVLWRRLHRRPAPVLAASMCLVVALGALPYLAWRFVEDLRVTSGLHGYAADAAGPIQAYLPGYLVDGSQRLIPRSATYATAVGRNVPWAMAQAAFPSLALEALFPRRSVADPRAADYVLAWGVSPASVAPVGRIWVVRPRAGRYPAVLVGKVKH